MAPVWPAPVRDAIRGARRRPWLGWAAMRIFVAGASGVIGVRLLPLLVADGHVGAALLAARGAEPVVCDVFDAAGLAVAVARFRPGLVMHQLTDLPDDAADIARLGGRNDRIRTEGTA